MGEERTVLVNAVALACAATMLMTLESSVNRLAIMDQPDYLVEIHQMKVVLKFVVEFVGELFVMTSGRKLMLE